MHDWILNSFLGSKTWSKIALKCIYLMVKQALHNDPSPGAAYMAENETEFCTIYSEIVKARVASSY